VTAVGNTAANRRFTFGVRGSSGSGRHQMQGLLVFGLGALLTSGSLLALHVNAPHAARSTQLVVLVAANLVSTALRFVLFRAWVFRPGHDVRLTPSHLESAR
jgi:putative flippase GtrA